MAIDDSICSSDDDRVELEAMRQQDSSWHPCKVSLSFNEIGLIVNYGCDEIDNIISDEEEAFMRLRIRSVPLQGDDCSDIKQGEHVLVAQQSQHNSLFFDAEVEKVLRVRHSKRAPCRCSFVIKWLHQDQHGGTSTVSSSSIMKLASGSIDTHTIISAFLSKLKTLDYSNKPPSPSILDDLDFEMDLNDLLEKQIEKINNSADVSKKTSLDFFLGTKGVLKEQIQRTPLATSKVKKQNLKDQNHFKRSTRSRNKLDTDMEVKDSPVSSSSIQEVLSENKSPLNPLAARAALASLMSSRNLEFSVSNEKKGFSCSSGNTSHKHAALEQLNGTESYNNFTGNSMSMFNKLASDTEDGFTSIIADGKLTQPTKPNRFTRSALKKNSGHSNNNVEKTFLEETNLHSSTNRRSTRSTAHKEKEIGIVEDKQTFQENISADSTELDSTKQNGEVQANNVSKDEKTISSPLHAEIELASTEKRIRKNCVEKTRLRSSTRIRSNCSTIPEDKDNGIVEATKGLEENKVPQHMKSNCSKENISTPESIIAENEESLSSPRTVKMNTKGMMSSTAKITQTSEGTDESKTNRQELKRKFSTLKKQEVRVSPRLNSLNRTRSSQNKS